jgi:hypothetical protein
VVGCYVTLKVGVVGKQLCAFLLGVGGRQLCAFLVEGMW